VGAARKQIESAQTKGLQVVSLSLDEVCELHAARELYSNALQGNILYDPGEVLQWLKTRFQPWLNRYSQPVFVSSPSEGMASAVRIEVQPDTSPQRTLSEAQLRTVLNIVSQRMLVDINEVLRSLGDESLKAAVLRAIEGNRNLKAHSGPQTIYLQWRIAP